MVRKIIFSVAMVLSVVLSGVVHAQEWTKTLPAKAVTAKVGDMVWATIPKAASEQADVGVYKVDSVEGNTATLVDKIGSKYPGVPGAVIHALGNPATLKVGDIAIGHAWGASKVIGRVKATEAGQVTLRYKWASSMTDKMMEHAQAPVVGVAPMAWAAYDNNGSSMYKGLVVALEGGNAWIATDSGHIIIQAQAKLRPLTLKADYKVGDVVKAYGWGFGYRPATVTAVTEPGYMYTVKIAGQEKPEDYCFADLVTSL